MELRKAMRFCHLSRSTSTRVIIIGAIIIWAAIFNMLTYRRPATVVELRSVAQPPAGWSQSRRVVHDSARVREPVKERVEPARAHTGQLAESHAPLSCFTDLSKPEDRVFNNEEKAMFRYLFDWPEVPTSSCKRMFKMGGLASGKGCLTDGDKHVCLDEPLSLAAAHDDCLIYSFGINYDWSFDEAARAFGCEVHSFDPSIDYPEGRRSDGITFHHFGIGRNNHTNVYGWQIYTLDQIMDILGHKGRTIHYLKMDAEGGEFDMMAQQLLDGAGEFVLDKVEQIGFEVHYRLDPRLEMGDFYLLANETIRSMRELGFNMVMWEYNKVVWQRYMFPGVERPVSLLYEILLIKNGPDTWDRSKRGRRQREAAAAAEQAAAKAAASEAAAASRRR
ncbi:uncharacterized protein LOC122394298 [Amphibalanus amphitrite]|uniref:uncharacterized protein LOC122394298 n=1 Tax=Amphibalanus amphitrite TaxID=1232801 RepID=UPI001C90637C|nr:uncharacterized protein LOC122394298 [Amphibalanus amphitrite]